MTTLKLQYYLLLGFVIFAHSEASAIATFREKRSIEDFSGDRFPRGAIYRGMANVAGKRTDLNGRTELNDDAISVTPLKSLNDGPEYWNDEEPVNICGPKYTWSVYRERCIPNNCPLGWDAVTGECRTFPEAWGFNGLPKRGGVRTAWNKNQGGRSFSFGRALGK